MVDDLANVHLALSSAAQETQRQDPEIVVFSFKLQEDIKEDVTSICKQHGTTVAEFMRQCCISLVRDYKE